MATKIVGPMKCPTCGSETTYVHYPIDGVACCPKCDPLSFAVGGRFGQQSEWGINDDIFVPLSMEGIRSAIRDALAEFVPTQPNYGGVIKKLRLEPGEILCLFCPGKLTAEAHTEIQGAMTYYFPNRKVLIFDEGIDLRVLHEEQVEESDVVDG